jgi:8-oxo-dGTP diphosphatase
MECFRCAIVSGELQLTEHSGALWLDKESLHSVSWLPADIGLVDTIKKLL